MATRKEWLEQAAKNVTGQGCLLWPFAKTNGYGSFRFRGVHFYAHREACRLRWGEPPTPRHEAAHSCGVSDCVNPLHLRWATPTENAEDKLLHGTHARGERGFGAVLTTEDVQTIRSSNEKQDVLAARYGVGQPHISRIKSGRDWGWLS